MFAISRHNPRDGAGRDALGTSLELMVDCNQGWRMPWDIATPWTLDHATEVAKVLEANGEGWIHLSDAPGLGITLDEDVLAKTASAQATFS